MGRSSFLRALWFGLAGAALGALAACGDGTQANKAAVPGGEPGEVVLHNGNAAEPGTLDPHLANGTWENNIIGDLLMGLTTENAKGEPVPGAAERWETSADGLTWTFHLREHQWSDGKPVTAGDFVFAWRRILDPKTAADYAYYLHLIKNAEAVNTGKMPGTELGVSAPDDKTLVVTLEHPAPYLLEYLTLYPTFPVPRHVIEAKGEAWTRAGEYVGNGAYVLKEWIPNDRVTLDKNPEFYDAANVKVDRVIYYPTTDYGAALRRLRAGELDIQDRLPQLEIDWLRANMPEILRIAPLLTTEYLVANEGHKPFDDARIREALNLALDRETLTSRITRVGHLPAYGLVPPGTANYPGEVVFGFKSMPLAERIKRAQQLMQQAGYGPNKRLKTTLAIRSTSPDALRVPAAIQSMWREIYVDVDLVQNDAAVFYAKLREKDFDIAVAGWSGDFNDATSFLDLLRQGNANNHGAYSNPKFDSLLDSANVESDLKKRGKLLAEAEQLALNEYALIPSFFWVSGQLVRPYVKGWESNATDVHRTRWMSIDEQARAATTRQ
jgi:oligopeptide transport system substrate-binding protein